MKYIYNLILICGLMAVISSCKKTKTDPIVPPIVAAPLEGGRLLVFTSDGALHLVSEKGLLERAFEAAEHGWPSHIRALGDSRALVYARDDGWYLIDASNLAELLMKRVLVVDDAIVAQQVDLSRPFGPAPVSSILLPLDPTLKSSELDVERRQVGPVDYVPTSDAARRLMALARRNGELVEPTARPGTIGWEVVPMNPGRAVALRLSGVVLLPADAV